MDKQVTLLNGEATEYSIGKRSIDVLRKVLIDNKEYLLHIEFQKKSIDIDGEKAKKSPLSLLRIFRRSRSTTL